MRPALVGFFVLVASALAASLFVDAPGVEALPAAEPIERAVAEGETTCPPFDYLPRVGVEVKPTRREVALPPPTGAGDEQALWSDGAELARLRSEVSRLNEELERCARLYRWKTDSAAHVDEWFERLIPEDRPSQEVLESMRYALADYPLELAYADGLWIAERFRLDDWKTHAATIDEALVLHFTPARLRQELPPELVAKLAQEWEDEGYFPD